MTLMLSVQILECQLPCEDNSISGTKATYVCVGFVIVQRLAEKDATHTSSKAW